MFNRRWRHFLCARAEPNAERNYFHGYCMRKEPLHAYTQKEFYIFASASF